jgi:hypothetical protein
MVAVRAFSSFRGLLQGDRIFPYIFLLCVEVSTLLKEAHEEYLLKGVQFGVGGPHATHLLFADDIAIFKRSNRT